MKFALRTAVAALTFVAAAPASAAVCDATNLATDPSSTACAVFAGNLLSNSNITEINAGFDAVGYAGADLVFPGALEDSKDFFSLVGNVLTFDAALTGEQFLAIHFGSAGGGGGVNNETVFYAFNFLTPTSSVTLTQQGFSDAIIVGTPGAIPEAATWAMMLLGFGAVGYSMRRRRGGLTQLA